MARRRRVFLANCSVHVIQRGNNKRPVFEHPHDYEVFLELLVKGIARSDVMVHAYALMTNHFHLLVTPPDETSLPWLMKWLDGRYVQYFNHRQGRMGTIWNGRYKGIPVDNERYWMTCLRYIEQNPVRAGLSDCAGAYRWSSGGVRARGTAPSWLSSHSILNALGRDDAERAAAYRALIGEIVVPSDPFLPR